MAWIAIILLGIVQGIAEFLPISSSGHITLLQYYFDSVPESLSLNVAVHLGTLCTILIYYRKFLITLVVDFFKGSSSSQREVLCIVIASLPTAVLGLMFKKFGEDLLLNPLVAGVCLILTGFILISTLWLRKADGETKISLLKAFAIGSIQGIAVLPGLSRSGLTIVLALWLGVEKATAARFSFLISIPAILGAGLLEFLSSEEVLDAKLLLLAATVAFLVGLFAISLVVWLTKKDRLSFFAYSLWLVGAAIIFQFALGS